MFSIDFLDTFMPVVVDGREPLTIQKGMVKPRDNP
jgi:hypothetical protein